MPVITSLGDGGRIWIIISLILIIPNKTRRYGMQMAIALIIGTLICNITLKPIVARIRPFDLAGTIPLINPPSDFSFPSGHTTSSFAAATALMFGSKLNAYNCASLILAFLIAFSRLYVYVHYPSDVLAGILIGVLSGYLSNLIYSKCTQQSVKSGG
ncbi:MAG: phosphatase PAP2 family protein [Firmicutes bacterium]|nr:phosphatase PAP2 family protein [Bacillota bacterium]